MEKECCRYGKLRVLELPILPPRWQGKGLVIGRGKDVAGCRASEEALRKAHEKLEERLRKHAFSSVRLNDRLRRKIEEHKRIEDKLRESNHRLKIAYEQAITYAKALNEEIAELQAENGKLIERLNELENWKERALKVSDSEFIFRVQQAEKIRNLKHANDVLARSVDSMKKFINELEFNDENSNA